MHCNHSAQNSSFLVEVALQFQGVQEKKQLFTSIEYSNLKRTAETMNIENTNWSLQRTELGPKSVSDCGWVVEHHSSQKDCKVIEIGEGCGK